MTFICDARARERSIFRMARRQSNFANMENAQEKVCQQKPLFEWQRQRRARARGRLHTQKSLVVHVQSLINGNRKKEKILQLEMLANTLGKVTSKCWSG